MSDHVWMEHEITKHRAQLPDLPYWRTNGWEPCDGPPPEPDVLHDPVLHDQDTRSAEQETPAKKTTAAKSAKPAEPEES